MKRFGSLLLAAVLGSVLTIFSTRWFLNEPLVAQQGNLPVSQVVYRDHATTGIELPDFTSTAEKVTRAVVFIKSSGESNRIARRPPQQDDDVFRFFFGPQGQSEMRPVESTGSGVLINADGYIVTNNHVVNNADVVEVTLTNNETFRAEVIGTDPDTDLALLKINRKNLPFLALVNSDNVKVGEWVLAVGNPLHLNSTVTAGIISAKGRNINIIGSDQVNQKNGPTAIESFLQTDAAINPGNSGGALVNMAGELVGINTAISSPTGVYAGYGFAIPSNLVGKVVEDLMTFGAVQRGWLGVQVANVTSELKKAEDLSVTEGAYISGFGDMEEKSAAREAGIRKGDVVTKIDETPINSSSTLIEYIGRKRPGDKVNMHINRQGKQVVIPVTLRNRDGKVGTVKPEAKDAVTSLGLVLEDVDSKLLKQLELTSGVKVKSIDNGKVARYTDMKEGFIITHVDEKVVKSAEEVQKIIKSKKAGDVITFSGVYENFPREYFYTVRM